MAFCSPLTCSTPSFFPLAPVGLPCCTTPPTHRDSVGLPLCLGGVGQPQPWWPVVKGWRQNGCQAHLFLVGHIPASRLLGCPPACPPASYLDYGLGHLSTEHFLVGTHPTQTPPSNSGCPSIPRQVLALLRALFSLPVGVRRAGSADFPGMLGDLAGCRASKGKLQPGFKPQHCHLALWPWQTTHPRGTQSPDL